MSNNGKRLAWVTGGGSGIGEAGAQALAADGWLVVVSGRRQETLDGVVANITKSGGKAEAIALDVSKSKDVTRAAEQILKQHGRIDLLVNSAGINVPKRSWADMELEGWDRLVEINLNGVLYCMRAVLPAMRAQQDGIIINVASWAGRHVSKLPGPAYTTTKHAVLALTHSFNMDECVNGLRACCLSPGEVATPILKLRPKVPSEEEQARMLQPEDCGRTIAFVASLPPRVCINEILISPTWNRGFVQTPANRD
jgi:NADP-dependent 3-hydroxy acid dehydrogenase YdfG